MAPQRELSRKVARCGTERECEENGQPIEGLTARRENGMNGERLFNRIPNREDCPEHNGEYDGCRLQGHAEIIRQIVSNQRAYHADENDCRPVD